MENYVESVATGGNASVETNINTKVNETETTVKTNQSGSLEVNVKDGEVKIKTSEGISPTIIITGIPEEKIEIGQISPDEEQEKPFLIENYAIYKFFKGLVLRLFDFFRF